VTVGELTSAEGQAVPEIFHGIDDLFDDRFEGFLWPVTWSFDAR
jgi:hypothetical protein